MSSQNKLGDIMRHVYMGSVGLHNPCHRGILQGNWQGPHPIHKDRKYKLRNFSYAGEYKLFHANQNVTIEQEDAAFIPEDAARLLVMRDQIEGDSEEAKAQRKHINSYVENSKKPGRIVTIKTNGETWILPGRDDTVAVLKDAFDTAIARRCHVIVKIQPYSFKPKVSISSPIAAPKAYKFS